MVLMSDGKNTAEIRTDGDHEYYLSAPPYLYHDHKKIGDVPKANADTVTMCNRIKASGIEIFTISFQIDEGFTEDLLNDCASSPQHTFGADNNEALIDAFSQIGGNLSVDVRLTQ